MSDVAFLLLIILLPSLLVLVVFGIYCVRSCPQACVFRGARAVPVAGASSSIYDYPTELGCSPRYDKQIGEIESIPVRERRRSVISSFTATLQAYFKNVSGNTYEITPFSMHLHYSKWTSCTLVWAECLCRFISPNGEPITRAVLHNFLWKDHTPLDKLLFAFSLYDTDGNNIISTQEFSQLLKDNSQLPAIKVLLPLLRDRELTFQEFAAFIFDHELLYLIADISTTLFSSFSSNHGNTAITTSFASSIASIPYHFNACFIGRSRSPTTSRIHLFLLSLIYWATLVSLAASIFVSSSTAHLPFSIQMARVGGLLINVNNLLLLLPFFPYLTPSILKLYRIEIHVSLGTVLVLASLLHVCGWITYYLTATLPFELTQTILSGIILVLLLSLMFVSALRRSIAFRKFFAIHRFQYLYWALAAMHAPRPYLFFTGPLLLYVLYLGMLAFTSQYVSATLEKFTGYVKLTFPRQYLVYSAGSHLYIHIKSISYFEMHPFDIVSSESSDTVSIMIKVCGHWTNALHCETRATIPVQIFGPMWSIFSLRSNYDCSIVICIGTGLSAAHSLLATFIDTPNHFLAYRTDFVCVSPSHTALSAFGNAFSAAKMRVNSDIQLNSKIGIQLLISEFAQRPEGLLHAAAIGRPNWSSIIDLIIAEKTHGKTIGAFFVGPNYVLEDIAPICLSRKIPLFHEVR